MKQSLLKTMARDTTVAFLCATLLVSPAAASSHQDAPIVMLDPAANTADLYAFLTERDGTKYLQVSLAVYPHEEPGIGPNRYGFDDNVLYQIFLSQGSDLAAGEDTVAYQFEFTTAYASEQTVLQSYLGIVEDVGDASQNFQQSYTVTKVEGLSSTVLGTGVVPPNNQGIATPYYNTGDDGNMAAKAGVTDESALDTYTSQSIASLSGGYRSFAGQREDGFYADVNSIFDLLQLRAGTGVRNSFDSQGGYNVHTIALEIPVSDIGGDQQVVGVYATTSRRQMTVLADGEASSDPVPTGNWVQVGRQGNPLFCEALIAIEDKNLYNRTKPTADATLFQKYAETPELAGLINALVLMADVAPTTDRTDLVGIFIPDLIKVDLSTGPARLPGGGADDEGYSRLGVFGGDALTSTVQAGFPGFPTGTIAGGWPNGRRYGDDVIDIAVTAIISDLRTNPLTIRSADGIDNVSMNDAVYHKVFPYAATPLNGRSYQHNIQSAPSPLLALSARGWVGTGDNVLIGGAIVQGNTPVTVLFRAQGPSLANYGVDGVLANPQLTVYRAGSDTPVAYNDDWQSDQGEDIMNSGYAPAMANESAVMVTLEPGAYTAVLSGVDASDMGNALIDSFIVD